MNYFKNPFRLLLLLALVAGTSAAYAQDAMSVALEASPNPAAPNQATTLTVYLTNRDASQADDIALSIPLPAGLEVATPSNTVSTAIGGTVTAISESNLISLSGASVATNTTSTVKVDIVSSGTGDYQIVTGPLSTSNLGNAAPAVTTVHIATDDALFASALSTSVNGEEVTFDLYLENIDSETLTELSVCHDLDNTFGSGNYQLVTAPYFADDPGSFILNPDFNGSTITEFIVSTPGDGRTSNDPYFSAGATAHIRYVVDVHNLEDRGYGIGSYESQVITQARSVSGMTTDLSDDGTDVNSGGGSSAGDAGEDDASVISITDSPSIGISSWVEIVDPTPGATILRFNWHVENLGQSDITDITLSQDLNAVFGAGNFVKMSSVEVIENSEQVSANASYNGNTNINVLNPRANNTLAPDERVLIRAEFIVTNITDQGWGLGIYQYQSQVNGLGSNATPLSDWSDMGQEPDSNGNNIANDAEEDDPTRIILGSYIGLASNFTQGVGTTVYIDYYLEAFGLYQINELQLDENLEALFGAGNFTVNNLSLMDDPGTLNLNASFDGSSSSGILDTNSYLAAGDTANIRLELDLFNATNIGSGLGYYPNSSFISGVDENGMYVFDDSTSGTDPDTNNDDVPDESTTTTITAIPDAIVGGALDYSGGEDFQPIVLNLYLENFGSETAHDVSLTYNLDDAFGEGNYTISAAPSWVQDPGTLSLNPSFDGTTDTNLFAPNSSLAALATAQVALTITLDTLDSDAMTRPGIFESQFLVESTDSVGRYSSDLSDHGTNPDPIANGDPTSPSQVGGEDTPTEIAVGNASIGIAMKTDVIGTQVIYTYTVENTGDIPIDNLYMENPLNPVFGSGNYSIQQQPARMEGPDTILLSPQYFGFNIFARIITGGYIDAGETIRFQLIVSVNTVSDVGNGFGTYQNQVTITGNSAYGAVSDTSDSGFFPDPDGDGNADETGENDVNAVIIGDSAVIGLAEDTSTDLSEVTLDLYMENLGQSMLSNISLTKNLDTVFGSGNYSIQTGPTFVDDPGTLTLNSSYNGTTDTELFNASSTLAAEDTASIRLVINVDTIADLGKGYGIYSSQSEVTATAPLGSFTYDLSDAGTNPDPDGDGLAFDTNENDPLIISLSSSAIGSALEVTTDGPYVTLDYRIQNLGAISATDLSLEHNLDVLFGAGNYSIVTPPYFPGNFRNLELNPAYDGVTDTELIKSGILERGVTEHFRMVLRVEPIIDKGSGLGVYSTQVEFTANTIQGAFSDLSDSGTETDANDNGIAFSSGEDDPTTFTVIEAPVIGIAVNDTVVSRTVTLDYYLENYGDVPLHNLSLTSILDDAFGENNYTITTAPSLEDDPESILLNAAYDGTTSTNLIDSGTLAVGETARIQLIVEVTNVTAQGVTITVEGQDYPLSGHYDLQASVAALSPANQSIGDLSDDGTDPDPNANQDPTESDENTPTRIVLHADAGGTVWNDLDGNGWQDAGEPGIAKVVIFHDSNGNGSLDSGETNTITDINGDYLILDLEPGINRIQMDITSIPMGFVHTGGLGGTPVNPYPLTLDAGEISNLADFGLQQQDASIGDFVWNDLDGDGIQDAGEPGISGIALYIDTNDNGSLDGGEPTDTTDVNGAFDFTSLPTGSYRIRWDATTVPPGFVQTGVSLSYSVSLAAGEDYNDADFGFQQQDASIGDYVWNDLNGDGIQDAGEPGMTGYTVFLDLNSNGTLDDGEPSDTTDANGAYDITDLPLGTYRVAVDASTVTTGFVITGGTSVQSVTIAAGEDYNDVDFGYQQQDASIGDFVWNDLNGDGVQDIGEPGLAGYVIYLDLNSNGIQDAGEPSDTTDTNGAFDIDDLPLGTYSVTVDSSMVTQGFVLTGGTTVQSVTIAVGEDYNDADFGYQQQNASIGDFVWNDLNGDGIQDAGEPGLTGYTVFLDLNNNGTFDIGEPSDTTDANGAFDITELPTGSYGIRLDASTIATGFVQTGGATYYSVNLAAGEDYNDADFGYQQQDASIGDFVWNDLNGDGVQDAGEPGMAGIVVFIDENANSILDAGEAFDTTDAMGVYDFTGLPMGTYKVVIDASTIPAGFNLSGGTASVSVSITAGEDYNDADFGYQQQDASIGDFVWNDFNGDGVQNSNEPGLEGILVYFDENDSGTLDDNEPQEITDSEGAYDFTDLPTGQYKVSIDGSTLPEDTVLSSKSTSLSVEIAAGEDYNDADFGFRPLPDETFVGNVSNFSILNDQGSEGLDYGDLVAWEAGTSQEVANLVFGVDAFTSVQEAIYLTSQEGAVYIGSGEFIETNSIQLLHDISLIGSGAQHTVLSGDDKHRVVIISDYINVAIQGLSITNGFISDEAYGAGILAENGIVLLSQVQISNNAAGFGGGIAALDAEVTLLESTVFDNRATTAGGGIFNHDAVVQISNSTISGNNVGENGSGGGAFVSSSVPYPVSIGKTPGLYLSQSTVSNNHGGSTGGGLAVDAGAIAQVFNAIISGNASEGGANDVAGELIDTSFSLIGDSTGLTITQGSDTNLLDQDALLDVLADNGGPTLTHALLQGSPALNAGYSNETIERTTDQRGEGFPRLIGSSVDMGSLEANHAELKLELLSKFEQVPASDLPNYLIHQVKVINFGPSSASNVKIQLSQIVPAGVSIASINTEFGTFSDSFWTIPTLPKDSMAILSINLSITSNAQPAQGSIQTTATIVQADQLLIHTEDDSGSISTSINSAQLTPLELNETMAANFSNSLIEQTLTVSNNNDVQVDGFKVVITGLPSHVSVYNSTGATDDGDPYLIVDGPLPANEDIEFLVQYFSATGKIDFLPNYKIEILTSSKGTGELTSQLAVGCTVSQQTDGSIVLEWNSIPGHTYYIRYSHDLTDYTVVLPGVVAEADRCQWVDQGPPDTESHPTTAGARFYQVYEETQE